MNTEKIIQKLEEECQEIAENIFINKDYSLPGWFEIYDLYQSIITILEKIDKGKIEKTIKEYNRTLFFLKRFPTLNTKIDSLAKSLCDYLGENKEMYSKCLKENEK